MEPGSLAQELLRLADEARAARERLRSLAEEVTRLRASLAPPAKGADEGAPAALVP